MLLVLHALMMVLMIVIVMITMVMVLMMLMITLQIQRGSVCYGGMPAYSLLIGC